jgi:hypothetical protein
MHRSEITHPGTSLGALIFSLNKPFITFRLGQPLTNSLSVLYWAVVLKNHNMYFELVSSVYAACMKMRSAQTVETNREKEKPPFE